jgi:type II secretory pathway pseudopilin PulG
MRSAVLERFAKNDWRETARHGLFEVVIVAIGVFLGLAVSQWQNDVQNRQMADEARTSLRAEMIANRASVFRRARTIAQLYSAVSAHPDQVSNYVFENRNRTLVLADSAWTLAVDSGALRGLNADERTNITGVYAAQRNARELAVEEMSKWSELAAFSGADATGEEIRDRNRAIRVWQAYAQRVQFAHCIIAARYEGALGDTSPPVGKSLADYCAARRPDLDPSFTYREWARRGWVSPAIVDRAELQ